MAKTVNVEVRARNGDSAERLIKRFIKKVKKENILEKYKEKMVFKKPSDKKREYKKRKKREFEIKKIKEQKEMN